MTAVFCLSNHSNNISLQHLHEILDMEMNALDWMMKMFPDIKEREEMRKIIGRYGLSGQQQVMLHKGHMSVDVKVDIGNLRTRIVIPLQGLPIVDCHPDWHVSFSLLY